LSQASCRVIRRPYTASAGPVTFEDTWSSTWSVVRSLVVHTTSELLAHESVKFVTGIPPGNVAPSGDVSLARDTRGESCRANDETERGGAGFEVVCLGETGPEQDGARIFRVLVKHYVAGRHQVTTLDDFRRAKWMYERPRSPVTYYIRPSVSAYNPGCHNSAVERREIVLPTQVRYFLTRS